MNALFMHNWMHWWKLTLKLFTQFVSGVLMWKSITKKLTQINTLPTNKTVGVDVSETIREFILSQSHKLIAHLIAIVSAEQIDDEIHRQTTQNAFQTANPNLRQVIMAYVKKKKHSKNGIWNNWGKQAQTHACQMLITQTVWGSLCMSRVVA